jgi:protein TonB
MVRRLSRRADPLLKPPRSFTPPPAPSSSAPVTEADLALAAGAARLAPPLRPWRRRPWTWGAALALHLAVLAFILLFVRIVPIPEEQDSSDVAVVFDHGGETQTAAPRAPLKGTQEATQAQPPPPPPPPQSADNQPEVNLNMPDTPLGEVPALPQQATPAPPQPRPAPPRPAPPRPPQRYVMMNGMSFGQASPAPPPLSTARPALNTSLPESNAEAVNAPELTIKGNIGADWKAELNRWVNEHKYYPDAAAEQGQQGAVTIEFTVDRHGNVTGLRMLDGSGSPFLDQAWLGLFAENTLPPFPPGTKSDTLDITATMHFELIQ